MPHFDEFGGDKWMCQAPVHRGNRVMSSRVESTWRPDISGHESAGNVCPPCIRAFEAANPSCSHGVRGECLRCWLEEETARDEPLNRLDYADPTIKTFPACMYCDRVVVKGSLDVDGNFAHKKCHKEVSA